MILAVLAAGLLMAMRKPRLALHDWLTDTAVYQRKTQSPPSGPYRRSRLTTGYYLLQELLGSD